MPARVLLLAFLPLLILACGAPDGRTADGADVGRSVAAIHTSKCGGCHVPVEPGTRSRNDLEEALARHKRRVPLTEREWAAMLEYLSPHPGLPHASASR